MVNNTITVNFEIEKGKSINQYYFSARIKLTDESKNLLREKLGNAVEFDNLDSYLDLNPENFYIYYNQYAYRDELYVRDDNSRYLASNLPLNHYGFSMELSAEGASIADYGFYPLYAIYNPSHYNKAEEKVFDDHGKLLPVASNMLDNFLSNKNNLSTQDVLKNVFLQLQKEAAQEIERLEKEREEERQKEEELNQKNEELKELVENGEIKVFKVIKGHDIGNGRSAAVLRLDEREENEITLDTNKYYIGKDEDGEYLASYLDHVDTYYYDNLFFVLNQSSHSGFESGFYSADSTDPHNYAKYSKEPYLRSDQLSEKLSNELKEGNNQVDAKFSINNEQRDGEAVVENEIKPRIKRATEENDNGETVSNSVNVQTKNKTIELQENSVLQEPAQELLPNKEHVAINDNLTADKNNLARLLHIAIWKGNVDEAMRLIKQVGTDITYMGRCPLYFASEIGNFDMVKLLIEHGVTPNNRDALGSTPLIVAIGKGNVKIVEYLIKAGANVNLSDQYGNVPLDFAPGKNMEIAKLLIDEGASFNRVMHVASIVNDTELVKYLITKGADVNCRSKIGDTPLHDAANHGNLDMVKLLLEYGAVPDSKNTTNRTPLIYAASKGYADIIKCLIEAGADVNTQMRDGYSPLHKAVINGDLDIIKLLIDKGARLEVYNNCGNTPLAIAKHQGQREIVEYIDNIVSNLSNSETISLDKTNINIKYNLAADKLDIIEKSIKDAVQGFKNAFSVTSDHDGEINVYVFNNRDDYDAYLKKVTRNIGKEVVGYTQMTNMSKGNAADVYVYLDSQGNLNQHTLEHEIGHAMHFANLGLSHILPQAMHEGIANYVASLEDGQHVNDHGDKEALIAIRNKDLKPDEILRNNIISNKGEHYHSDAEQVIKFLEGKYPDMIDNLLKNLSTSGTNRSQGEELVERFLAKLKGYDQEFKQWVKVQLSGEKYLKHEHEVLSTQGDRAEHSTNEERKRSKRSLEEDKDEQEEVVITSVIDSMKDDKEEDNPKHPLKVKMGESIETGKYKVELQVTYDDVKNFYDIVRNKYHVSKEYNYEQVMVLYNEIVRPANNHHYESFTLDKAYVAGDHLFIKGQDFGTLDDFNEMFYKSDELV